jgi:sugar lactone lactonase YvrE
MSHSIIPFAISRKALAGTAFVSLLSGLTLGRANAAGTLYWSSDRIDRASTAGLCRQTVQPQAANSSILDIDFDPETGKLYFPFRQTNGTTTIRRCDFDGGSVEIVHSSPFPGPGIWVLDIDRVNRKLYWTETGALSRIMRANLDGSNVEQIRGDMLIPPFGVAIDPAGGKMYWTEHSNDPPSGSIHRVNFDGTAHEQIAVSGQVPHGVAVHHSSGKVYWTDGNVGANAGGVYRANLDFTNVEQITSGPQGLRHLDIDEAAGMLYFGTQVQPSGVYRCDLDGGGLVQVIVTGAFGIACVPEKLGFVCPGDANLDLIVNIDDILSVINSWGPCRGCPADLNGDGVVNIDDLLFVVNHWTN